MPARRKKKAPSKKKKKEPAVEAKDAHTAAAAAAKPTSTSRRGNASASAAAVAEQPAQLNSSSSHVDARVISLPALPDLSLDEEENEEVLWDSNVVPRSPLTPSPSNLVPPSSPSLPPPSSSSPSSPSSSHTHTLASSPEGMAEEPSLVLADVPEGVPLQNLLIRSLYAFHDALAGLFNALQMVTQAGHGEEQTAAQAHVDAVMGRLLACDFQLQAHVSELMERHALHTRMQMLETQVRETKEGFVSFAKELGSFERELYEFTAQDHSQVPLSVRDVTMLAERLGVMSHSPAQIQEKMGSALSRPPGPQPGVRGGAVDMSKLHLTVEELATVARGQPGDVDFFLLSPMIEPLVVTTAKSVVQFHEISEATTKEVQDEARAAARAKYTSEASARSRDADLLANLQLTRTSSIEGLLEAPANFAADDIDFDDDDF